MTNQALILCIGGSHDAERQTVETDVLQLPVMEKTGMELDTLSLAAPLRIRSELYYHERLRSGNREWVIYRHESLTLEEVIDKLLERYF